MNRKLSCCLVLLLSFICIVVVMALSAQSLLSDLCGNNILLEKPSLDGRTKFLVFERNCGATTGFSIQGTLLDSAESLPNTSGNVFVFDYTDTVNVKWISPVLIKVEVSPTVRMYKKNTLVDGIHIEYHTPAKTVSQTYP